MRHERKTMGWATATHPVKDGELSDEAFLQDTAFTEGGRETMLLGELERRGGGNGNNSPRLTVAVFENPVFMLLSGSF